ncbi:MAG: hypothetical protein AB7C90_02045 [Bacteroidales bacterium]
MNSKQWLFPLMMLLLMTANFRWNVVGSAWPDFFANFQQDSEALAVGRLVLSDAEGPWAHTGFMGLVLPPSAREQKYAWQYRAFAEHLPYQGYEGYYSQPALHTLIYYGISKLLGTQGEATLSLLYLCNSLFSALQLTLFLMWVQTLWGTGVGAGVGIGILFAQWITVFGRNLYWVFGAFYIPLVVSLWLLEKSKNRQLSNRKIFVVLTLAMGVKCLCNGFEFISSVLVMAMIPFIFYAIDQAWGWKRFVSRFLAGASGALAGVISVMVLLSVQLSFEKGSLAKGWEFILHSLQKRTFGSGTSFDSQIAQSLQSDAWTVFMQYWHGHLWNISHWFEGTALQGWGKVEFSLFFPLLAAISLWILLQKDFSGSESTLRRNKALIAALWVSFAGPLSWFFIFKGHAFIHPHMDHIVWHFPFMLFAFVLMAVFMKQCITACFSEKKISKEAHNN